MSDSVQPHELYSLPGSSVHGILQERILEWVATPSSRGPSWSRNWTRISHVYLHWQVVPRGKPYFCLREAEWLPPTRNSYSWLHFSYSIVVVQSPSHGRLFATPWTAAGQAPLSSTISWSLLKFMSNESVMPSNHYPLSLPSPPALKLSNIRFFSNELALRIRWLKYWSFSFSNSPPSEYSGLISFGVDWCDLAVQGSLKSLLQHHSLKASILRHSAFFMVQLSHLYITTGKTVALTWLHKTFAEKCKYYNRHTYPSPLISFPP